MKTQITLLALAVLAAGCSKDSIYDNPWGGGEQQQSSSDPQSSGVTGPTTLDFTTDEEDLMANTSFGLTVSVVFSESGKATVSGTQGQAVTIDGNKVTIDNRNVVDSNGKGYKVKYELSGSTSNGYFKVYSDNKQALVLNGVSITNPSGAAINNQGKKRCFVVVNGENRLADGASYTQTPADEDEKAAFFSEGQLIFSGSGSLTVSAQGKAGITSDDYLLFLDAPSVKVNASAGHGLRGKDYIRVDGGTLEASVSAAGKKGMSSDSLVVFNGGMTTLQVSGGTVYDSEDKDYTAAAGVRADQVFIMNAGTLNVTSSGQGGKGISCDGPAYFQGGTVTLTVTGGNHSEKSAKGVKIDGAIYISDGELTAKVSNHEAIESKSRIEISGGTVYAQSKDDAINSAGILAVTGGQVCAYSTGNDGLDANGNCFIEGGVVYAVGSGSPEVAVDANSEGGYRLYVNGGVLFTLGGLESGAVLSQSCYQASWNRNTWYSLTADGTTYAFQTPSSGGTSLVVSATSEPEVKSGVSVSGGTVIFNGMAVLDGSVSGGSTVSLSTYSGGTGMGGPGSGPGGGPGGPGGGRP